MLRLLSAAILVHSTLVIAQSVEGVGWPNAFPKQIVAVRRRQGITKAEFFYHHTIVHGHKSWNAPDSLDQPLAYFQDHAFDSAYGINTTKNLPHTNYFDHDDVTELYSRTEEAFSTPPPNDYTRTVIGPDGNSFSDRSAAISMFAYENFVESKQKCVDARSHGGTTYNAFIWLFADDPNSNTIAFDNSTFASAIMDTMISAFPPNSVYNASTHTSVPGLDSRLYFGGLNNPTLNAVLKFWLCDKTRSVTELRNVQKSLIANNDKLGINLDQSFVVFTKSILIYDRSTNTPFDPDRVTKDHLGDRYVDGLVDPFPVGRDLNYMQVLDSHANSSTNI